MSKPLYVDINCHLFFMRTSGPFDRTSNFNVPPFLVLGEFRSAFNLLTFHQHAYSFWVAAITVADSLQKGHEVSLSSNKLCELFPF